MTARMDGSVAVITGASSGIGRATALALHEEGAAVALLARRSDKLDDLARRITGDGGRTHVVETDVTDAEQARAALDETAAALGSIDVLVNNAGVGKMDHVLDASVDDWRNMLDTNVMGLMQCTRSALPHLLRSAEGPRGFADVVNISSVAGRVARAGNGGYAATKHAVGAFSESLRQEVTGRHVRVALVEPGMVRTELTEAPDRTADPAVDDVEWLDSEDVADAVTYVVTRPPRASVNELLLRPTEQLR